MTGPARIFQTTAVRLALIYLAVFSVASGLTLFYVLQSVQERLQIQIVNTLDAEIELISDRYRRGGVSAIIRLVHGRAGVPGASLYQVVDRYGRRLAGNIEALPLQSLQDAGGKLSRITYQRSDDQEMREAFIRVFRLAGGYTIIVGRDLTEQRSFREILTQSLQFWVIVIAILSVVTWLFVSRRVMMRIDAIMAAGRRIMHGRMGDRLPLSGTGDEFDRLAGGLNEMLERIEALLEGFRQISDNIAHELKTPLTRMRNRLELALAQPQYQAKGAPAGKAADQAAGSDDTKLAMSPAALHEVLSATIEECDTLIQTFDALLKIARIEAGSTGDIAELYDLGETVSDVIDLYAPLADERGVTLNWENNCAEPLAFDRQLIAQALANLIENAIKYADSPAVTIDVKTQCNDAGVKICVCDNGPGIDEQDRLRVVERFVRLEKNRDAPGAGLGLCLVQAVARMHKGRFTMSDNMQPDGPEGNRGLCACIHLPSAKINGRKP